MEGPSIVILVEEAQKFVGSRVLASRGSSKLIDINALEGQELLELKSWGKHFLLIFEKTVLKVHFMLFGSYRIDEPKLELEPRLALRFKSGEIFFYACSLRLLCVPLSSLYDWSIDIMSNEWDEKLVVRKLGRTGQTLICDALLDQEIFAGVGNIIKNEVLFRLKLQPEVKLKTLSSSELLLLARETRIYSFQFYIWKKQYLLRKNWQIYRKKSCPTCGTKVQLQPTGRLKRRSFFCPVCQRFRKTLSIQKSHITSVKTRLRKSATQIAALQRQMPTVTTNGSIEIEH